MLAPTSARAERLRGVPSCWTTAAANVGDGRRRRPTGAARGARLWRAARRSGRWTRRWRRSLTRRGSVCSGSRCVAGSGGAIAGAFASGRVSMRQDDDIVRTDINVARSATSQQPNVYTRIHARALNTHTHARARARARMRTRTLVRQATEDADDVYSQSYRAWHTRLVGEPARAVSMQPCRDSAVRRTPRRTGAVTHYYAVM